MANQYISAFTQTWNNGATTYNGIKLNVTDSASASDSKLIDLQIGGTSQFNVSKAGALTTVGALKPSANDGAALGASGTAWADLFLASGAVINFAAGDATLTHSSNLLAFASASGGYTFDTLLTVGHTANLSIGGNADNLEVMGTTAATGGMALGMFNATAGTGAHFDFYRSKNASVGSATVVASGDNLGSLNWYGAQQTGTFATQTMAAQIRAEVDGTVTSGGSGDMPGRIVFSTTADAGAAVTDRLILDAAGVLKPSTNDGVALGTTALGFADLHGATGFTLNIANGDAVLTHSTGVFTVSAGDLRVTTAGTNAASAVTVGGTQTLTNKTLTTPTLTLKQGTGPTPTAEGDIQWDTDDNAIVVGDGSSQKTFRPNHWETIYVGALSSAASHAFTSLSAYRIVRLTLFLVPVSDTTALLRVSTDNGSSYDSGANYAQLEMSNTGSATTPAGSTASQAGIFLYSDTIDNADGVNVTITFLEFNQNANSTAIVHISQRSAAGTNRLQFQSFRHTGTTARNALGIFPGSGDIAGFASIEGVRG